MAGNVHDGLIARLSRLCQAGDERVTVVMPATFDAGVFTNFSPDRLEAGAWLGRIGGLRPSGRKDKPFRLELFEFLQVPCRIGLQDFEGQGVEGDGSSAPSVGLGFSNDEVGLVKMDTAPLESTKFLVAEPAVKHQHQSWIDCLGAALLSFVVQQPFLFGAVRLADVRADSQFQRLLSLQLHSDDIALLAEKAEQETHLLIDSLWGGLLFQA